VTMCKSRILAVCAILALTTTETNLWWIGNLTVFAAGGILITTIHHQLQYQTVGQYQNRSEMQQLQWCYFKVKGQSSRSQCALHCSLWPVIETMKYIVQTHNTNWVLSTIYILDTHIHTDTGLTAIGLLQG